MNAPACCEHRGRDTEGSATVPPQHNLAEPVTYFIQAVDGGPIKIGRSTRNGLLSRLASIQTGNPCPLRVTRVLEGDQEKRLHSQFEAYRIVGEWFHAVPELAEMADALSCDPGNQEYGNGYQAGYLAGWSAGAHWGHSHARQIITQRLDPLLDEQHDDLVTDAEIFAMEAFRDSNAVAEKVAKSL